MHGPGIMYNKNGEVIYSGNFAYGKKSGYGVFRTADGAY